MKSLSLFWIFLIFPAIAITAPARFFYSGDGTLLIKNQKTGIGGSIKYKNPDGSYHQEGLKKLHQVFGAPWNPTYEQLSLRFIEMLDYVQERYAGGILQIRSGYRSPANNDSLRNQGKLAAVSSMHIEGAAADLILAGTPSSKIFEDIRTLGCCGIGYYGSAHFHLDTGPVRWWDRNTSKTESKEPQLNAKVIFQPQFDRYFPGENILIQFMRITNFPIDVSKTGLFIPKNRAENFLEDPDKNMKNFLQSELQFEKDVLESQGCLTLSKRSSARLLQLRVPDKTKPGLYQVFIKFCNKRNYTAMPDFLLSRVIEITPKD